MTQPTQEDLLGYLLGALDAEQERAIQQSIDLNPQLEEQLLELKSTLAPLELLATPTGSQPGLARRTVEMLALYQNAAEALETTPSEPSNLSSTGSRLELPRTTLATSSTNRQRMSPATHRPDRPLRSGWSINDFLVLAAGLAVLAAIGFPALSYSRFAADRSDCQSNLVSLNKAFQEYSDINGGKFVAIPLSGNRAVSGIFAPALKEAGLLENDDLLACAGSDRSNPVHIPTFDTLDNATGPQLAYLQQTMSGDYGYALGYLQGDVYVPPQDLGRSNAILLADRPSPANEGFASQNHRGAGQNCLFEDGHWEFVTGFAYGEDPIYKNDLNVVAAGIHLNDIVIGASHNHPVHFQTAIMK